jgi:Domain of unknown function (DUF4838)
MRLKLLTFILIGLSTIVQGKNFAVKGPDNPKPHEKTAVKELNQYLSKVAKKITVDGAEYIVFHVGDTKLALSKKLDSKTLPDEKWVIKAYGKDVVLNGGGTRGCLYAVYHFLEDFCDVHWWNQFEEHVPLASDLHFPALDLSSKPTFAYRDIFRQFFRRDGGRFAIRNRLNRDGSNPVSADFGGACDFGPPDMCHTFDRIIPASKYLASHPEYFSLRSGKRVGGQRKGQLCLTNKELQKLFLEKLRELIKTGEAKARKNHVKAPVFYDVSMNDNHNFCQCKKCMAKVKKYGHSGLYLNFVNRLAREIHKAHPNIFITTLAYYYTEPTPKGGVRPDSNVIVRLCDTTGNGGASIHNPDNKTFKDLVEKWKELTNNLMIWDYAITFTQGLYGKPFPSEYVYSDLYKFYRDNNVTGIFWEHERPHVADMWELKYFLETKLLENPDTDTNKLINLFMDKYYGPAGKYILQYRQLIYKFFKAKNWRVGWMPNENDFAYLSNKDILVCQKLFDKAEKAVSALPDKMFFNRVRRARFGLDRLTCRRQKSLRFIDQGVARGEKPLDAIAVAERLSKRMDYLKNFADSEKLFKKEQKSMPVIKKISRTVRQPKKFRTRRYYDFTAGDFQNHKPAAIKLVKDEQSDAGCAMQIDASQSKYYALPMRMGVYDTEIKKDKAVQFFNKVLPKRGYNWYYLGRRVKLPRNSFLYLTRAWTVQIPLGNEKLQNKTFEIWASIKFAGPVFYPKTDKGVPNRIWIDRVIVAYPK